jgi:hypothetical protein
MTSLPIPSAGIRPIRRGWEGVPLVALKIVAYPLWLWGMARQSIEATSKDLMKISGISSLNIYLFNFCTAII